MKSKESLLFDLSVGPKQFLQLIAASQCRNIPDYQIPTNPIDHIRKTKTIGCVEFKTGIQKKKCNYKGRKEEK